MAVYKEAAIAVLRDASVPLSCQEITRLAIDRGLVKPGGRTPEASMGAAMYTDIKKNGEAATFRQVGRNAFELRPDYADPAPPRDTKAGRRPKPRSGEGSRGNGRPDPGKGNARGGTASAGVLLAKGEQADPGRTDAQAAADSRRIGTAGEFRVMSELLFRGYGADRSSIDDGVDIKASKGYDNFDIQVKTVTKNKNDRYITNIRKRPFDRHDTPNMYYVFVLRDPGNDLDFVVMPSKDIRRMIKDGYITLNLAGYQTSFKKDGDEIFLGSRNVRSYRNYWDL